MREIIGHGGGGDSHTHYEATDSLHNTAYARVLDLVSEGEVLGLANGLASVYLNQTPVANADGSLNFKNVTVDYRAGTQDQSYIAGFPDVENEISVGVELKSGTPWVHAINNTSLSAIRIALGVPMLSRQDTTNGDILGYQVDYTIELSKDGGAYSTVVTSGFIGKTTSEYQRSTRIDLPPASTGWQVRVTRITPNANVASIADTTSVISYTEVIDAKLRYPMSAIVGIQVDAAQFQNVPTRAYDMFGRIVQVPSNYDAIARTYSGVWDGTFKPSWTSNPAWVFRDLVLNDRYGLGDRISAAQLDKWSLYQIAQYCDVKVPNGKGGLEPRFTCNLYLQSRKQAFAVLQDIASIFRGISYWGGGTIIASADMPADPVYVYTAANVIDGKFTRAGSGKGTRYTVALITWNDPEDFYKQKVEYVEDPEGIRRYGIQQTELIAFGCSSQGQAQRAGRWVLATSRLETEALSFDVGLDGAIALPGQIVRIADPSRMGRRAGGRIHSATARTVVLDRAPVINPGDNLTVILPTGKSESRAVASVAGDSVTVNADWSALPRAQSVWSVDSTELSAPLFRVLSVTEKDETTYSIAAVQHEPGKFDFVESGTAITPHPQTALNVTKQVPPGLVTLAGRLTSIAGVENLVLQVSCNPVAGAVAYECAYRRGSDNWVAVPRQLSPIVEVLGALPGTYLAKMVAVNSIGVTSVESASVVPFVLEVLRATATVYAYAVEMPPPPSGIASYQWSDGTFGPAPAGWSLAAPTAPPGGNATLWAANAAVADATDVLSSFDWAQADVVYAGYAPAAAGTGPAGYSNARVFAYQRKSTLPVGTPGAVSYDFTTGTITTASLLNGWQKTIPASDGNPLYVISASASATGTTDSIASGEWSGAVVLTNDGGAGAPGLNSAAVTIYQRNNTGAAPALPSVAVTYTFSTAGVAGLNNGWATTVPAASAGKYLFVSTATAVSSAATDTIATTEWAAAQILVQDGAAGTPGVNSAVVYAYQRAASAPTGTPGAVTYDFASNTITTVSLANSWQKSIPAANGSPLYVTAATASSTGGTDTIASGEWSGAVIMAADGGAGAPGLNSATIQIYQRAASSTSPAKPSASCTYTFATGALTGLNNGWTTYIPSTGGAYLHTTTATAIAATATDAIPASEWAAVQLMYDAADLVAAQAAADAANAAVADIASDSKLTPGEKPDTIARRDAILAEQAGIESQANAFGIIAEKGVYTAAITALTTYLATLTGWDTLPGPTISIVGTTFRQKFADVYAARQALLDRIAIQSANLFAGLDTPLLRWSFDTGLDSFSSAAVTTDLTYDATNGYMVWTPTGSNSSVRRSLAASQQFKGSDAPKVRARVKRLSGAGAWEGSFYYVTAGHSYAAPYYAKVDAPANPDDWTILEWDMSKLQTGGGTDWLDSTITNIRFDLISDFTTSPVTTWAFDWVAVGKFNTGVSPAQVQAAQAQAAAAVTASGAALAAIDDMARDDLLSPVEKPGENVRWNAIVGERPGIDAQAASLGVTTERTAYTNAYNALNTYITGLGAEFTTIPGAAVSIVGATYRTNFTNYFNAKQALLNAIAAKSATVAQWSGIGGAGKPADNASSDLVLTATGTVTVLGNRATKASGVAAWDSSAISKESYFGGAFASVRADGRYNLFFGLNSDPATDSSYASIDYALELQAGGALNVYESGVLVSAAGTYVAGDMLAVIYDGSSFRYCKNGTVLYTTLLAEPRAAPLFFDSSFNTVGASLSNIRVGPMTSNNWGAVGGTGKPESGATVGAPAGTQVAGMDAEQVAAGAAVGNALAKPFSVAMSGNSEIYGTASGKAILVGSVTATVTSATNYASIQWLLTDMVGGTLSLQNATSLTVTVRSNIVSNPGTVTGVLTCIVTGIDGRTCTASKPVRAEHL